MPSVFTRIVNGEIPCHKVAEDENYLAFLDISPLREGHTLVIPKKEVDYILLLDDDVYPGLWNFAKKIGLAIENAVPCKRIGITVIGLEVPHAHIHLIPIDSLYDMDFSRAKLNPSQEELSQTAARIRKALGEL